MGALRLRSVLFTSLLLLPVIAKAVLINPTMTIAPGQPTPGDNIVATLSGAVPTTGFTYDVPVVTINQSAINIDFNITSPTGIVLPVIVGFSADADIGNLAIGDYDVSANFIVDGILETVLKQSISVVPLPAAVWLFASGCLGLVGVAKRKKTP